MSYYKSKHFFDSIENFSQQNNFKAKKEVENKTSPVIVDSTPEKEPESIKTSKIKNMSPDIWGPGLWLVLHLGSANYPEKASSIAKNRMKFFILGLPYILPCDNCFEHALDYIEKNKDNLDMICSGKESLFKFFNDFHNSVNDRLKKPYCNLDQAKFRYC